MTDESVTDTGQDETVRRPRRRRRTGQVIRTSLLNIAAAGGAVCIGAVLAALLFDITLIMFKTGSMAPAIPAGSLAVVREIPAQEIETGDVVTVDREDNLPVTHRVISMQELDGGKYRITMQGDANSTPDPHPYIVSSVRIVMWSVPGLAYPVAAISTPLGLGITTLSVAALVTWVMWPRPDENEQDHDG